MAVSVARENGSEELLITPVAWRSPHSRPSKDRRSAPQGRQHFLNFLPLPHGQGLLRSRPFM